VFSIANRRHWLVAWRRPRHRHSQRPKCGAVWIDLWAYFNTTADEQILAEKYIQRFSTPSEGWTLTKLASQELLLAMASADGSDWGVASPPLAIPTDRWVHFAATRRAGKITLFMNGGTSRQASLSSNLDSGSSLKFGHRGNPTDTPGCDGALAPSETSLRRWLSPNDHWFDRGISDGQPRLQRADGVIVAPGARCATKYLAINR
jgi:hypothetical protein